MDGLQFRKDFFIFLDLQQPEQSWDHIKSFSKSLMMILEQEEPRNYTTNMSKDKRKNRIFLDYLRNGYGATAVLPYSVRARENPTVALPIAWSQLKNSLAPDQFTIKKVLKLVQRRKDPWASYWKIKQSLPKLK
jgi:bifunctional non-homologous end joining protein LigD